MADIKQTCRLCLDSANASSTSIDDAPFKSKLASVSNLTFDVEDHFPSKVCPECWHKITEFYEFIETVRTNQEQLRTDHARIKVESVAYEGGVESESGKIKTEQPVPEDDDDGHPMFYVEVAASEGVKDKNDDDEGDGNGDEDADDGDDDKDFDPSESDQDDYEENVKKRRKKKTKQPVKKVTEKDNAKKLAEEDRLIEEHFTLQCDICSETLESWRKLTHHTKKFHNKKATIHCCNKAFSRRFNILYHINSHRKPFQCELCGKGLVDKYELKRHIIKKHTSTEEKPFKCDQCGHSFLKETILKTHMKRHVQVKCTLCDRMLSNEYCLKSHMLNMHTQREVLVCPTCGKPCPSRHALDLHVKKHSDIPQEMAPCPECHKMFIKSYLPVHVNSVHKGEQVTCEICNKVFPYKRALSSHKSQVHGAKMIGCDICGKQYKKQLHLKEHMASHAGVKLYSCEVCGVEMNSISNFRQHKKKKHPEEWLKSKEKKNNDVPIEMEDK